MTIYPLTAFVTLLAILLLFATGLNVGRARGRYGIKAPAVTGHEMFERAYRIQMNTLENIALILPALWIYAGFIDDRGAGFIGLIWIAARVWYAVGYQKDPLKRFGGFGLSVLAFAGAWLGAFWGVARTLLH